MAYTISIENSAEKAIKRLSPENLKRVISAIQGLKTKPKPSNSKKLKGYKNTWRLRIGGLRMLYEILEGELRILVLKVASRGQVYK